MYTRYEIWCTIYAFSESLGEYPTSRCVLAFTSSHLVSSFSVARMEQKKKMWASCNLSQIGEIKTKGVGCTIHVWWITKGMAWEFVLTFSPPILGLLCSGKYRKSEMHGLWIKIGDFKTRKSLEWMYWSCEYSKKNCPKNRCVPMIWWFITQGMGWYCAKYHISLMRFDRIKHHS